MNMSEIKEQLDLINKLYSGSSAYLMLGRNLLTLADRMNTPRAQMWSSQTEQIVNLINPETPRLFTGAENFVGINSSGYTKIDNDTEIIAKIEKFEGIKDSPYLLVCFDKKKEVYFVKNITYGTILTETYGYKHKNEVIDSFNVGDTIPEETIISRSNSYDDEMNYGYATNLLAGYLLDHKVIEDPVFISYTARDKLNSYEYATFKRSINDNDILLNLYGDKFHYKAFPDIGEMLEDSTLCGVRRIQYNKALYALKNMTTILNSDSILYVPYSVGERVVDINIYSNKPLDEIPDTSYNLQLKKYLKFQQDYNKKILEVLGPILEMDSCYYEDELTHVYARAERELDPKYVWQDNGKVFNNIIISFTVEEVIPVDIGSKLCGRYGDKGVISAIIPDYMMPKLPDGRHLEIVCSIHGVGGRNNPGQLIEVEANFQADQVINLIKKEDDIFYKEHLLLKFIKLISTEEYHDLVKHSLDIMDNDEKKDFFKYIESTYDLKIYSPPINGININNLAAVYREFGIKPIRLTQFAFGREIPLLRNVVVGAKYIIKLKHHPKTKFSARSTGSINSKDLPIKSSKSKQGQALYSNSAIKFGENELFNLLLAMRPDVLANQNMLFSSSITGRRDIKQLYENELFPDRIVMNDDATNRNAEIYRILLKCGGVSLNLSGDEVF